MMCPACFGKAFLKVETECGSTLFRACETCGGQGSLSCCEGAYRNVKQEQDERDRSPPRSQKSSTSV